MATFSNFEQFLEAYLIDNKNATNKTEAELKARVKALDDAGKLPEFIADRRGL
jgi:hypothetical protein